VVKKLIEKSRLQQEEMVEQELMVQELEQKVLEKRMREMKAMKEKAQEKEKEEKGKEEKEKEGKEKEEKEKEDKVSLAEKEAENTNSESGSGTTTSAPVVKDVFDLEKESDLEVKDLESSDLEISDSDSDFDDESSLSFIQKRKGMTIRRSHQSRRHQSGHSHLDSDGHSDYHSDSPKTDLDSLSHLLLPGLDESYLLPSFFPDAAQYFPLGVGKEFTNLNAESAPKWLANINPKVADEAIKQGFVYICAMNPDDNRSHFSVKKENPFGNPNLGLGETGKLKENLVGNLNLGLGENGDRKMKLIVVLLESVMESERMSHVKS
jgi:hypothetical protein